MADIRMIEYRIRYEFENSANNTICNAMIVHATDIYKIRKKIDEVGYRFIGMDVRDESQRTPVSEGWVELKGWAE